MLLLSSCTQNEELAAPRTQSAVSAAEIRLLKQVFTDQHYSQQLLTDNYTWVPLWDQAIQPRTAESTTTIYVPLAPYRAGKSEPVTLLGSKKYLRIERAGTVRSFSVALYLATLPTDRLNLQQWLSWYQDPAFLTTFTGTRALKDLTTGQSVLLDYQNGTSLSAVNHSRATSRTATAVKAASSQNSKIDCAEYDTWCTWTLNCSDIGFPVDVITRGMNTDCETPPPMCTDAGWERTASETFYFCPAPAPPKEPTSMELAVEYVRANDEALLGPCPGLTDAWLEQIQFKPPAVVMEKLERLSQQRYNNGLLDSYYVQSIRDAKGPLINLDKHSIFFQDFPTINGHKLSIIEFMDYLRLNLTQFTGTSFNPSLRTGEDETNLWNTSPLGAVIVIGIPIDRGSVITSRYYTANPAAVSWNFTTIHDPYRLILNHPVSGTRTFGIYKTTAGYIFYTQGADRLTGNEDALLGFLSDIQGSGKDGFQFTESDKMWEGLIGNVKTFFDQQEIIAQPLPPIANRPDFDAIQAALKNGKSLSTIDCP
jgi:hypothetical protein